MNRHPREKSEAHLSFIRQLPCVITGRPDVEAAHLRASAPLYGKRHVGMGEKPDDKWVLPLSTAAHRAQHAHGNELSWWHDQRINPFLLAAFLWLHSGDQDAAMAVLSNARNLSQ